MVSKADVKTGVFTVEVGGPSVVITRVDVSNSPGELTEDDVSAEMVSMTVLSTEMVPSVVISAEVVV